MKKLDQTISIEDDLSGAYIEVWTRGGIHGARMNFFEDKHLPLERLRKYKDAIDKAIKLIEES